MMKFKLLYSRDAMRRRQELAGGAETAPGAHAGVAHELRRALGGDDGARPRVHRPPRHGSGTILLRGEASEKACSRACASGPFFAFFSCELNSLEIGI